jgi:hypothetical protein
MKLSTLTFCVFLLSFLSVQAQHGGSSENEGEEVEDHHCLFKKNSISLGLGASYSFHFDGIGINSRVYYNLGHHICFGPEFSFFKAGELDVYDFNLIIHYIFETKLVGIYPLIGANYTIEKEPHESEEAFGVIFGAGLHRNFGLFTVFAEYGHVQSRLKDDFVTVGAMLTIK